MASVLVAGLTAVARAQVTCEVLPAKFTYDITRGANGNMWYGFRTAGVAGAMYGFDGNWKYLPCPEGSPLVVAGTYDKLVGSVRGVGQVVWNLKSGKRTLLDANGMVEAVEGNMQAGSWQVRPVVWFGNEASRVLLGPGRIQGKARSIHRGLIGGHYIPEGGTTDRACYWPTWDSPLVDIHPPGLTKSIVVGVGDGTQVGAAWYWNSVSYAEERHPVMWRGTAASVVDLLPAGYRDGIMSGASGGWQLGVVFDSAQNYRPGLWNGSAASFVDLSLLCPPEIRTYLGVYAHNFTRIGGRLVVVGTATDVTNQRRLVRWYLPDPPAKRGPRLP